VASAVQRFGDSPSPLENGREPDLSRRSGSDEPAPRAALCFSGVTHHYGEHRALDNLQLSVARGQTLALLGPNGAGKSTTISVLLGLVRPGSGHVEVLGLPPKEAVASGRVGAMLQTGAGTGLPPGVRVIDVLRMVRRLYRHPAALDVVVERAAITTLLHRRADHLSGGQAQRVRFALAIAGDPDVVFLDEPTAAMDVEARRTFWKMIRALGDEGRTIVFATHHLAEADQVADRVVVLHHGRVVADGPGATLKAAVASRQLRFVSEEPDCKVLNSLEGVTDVQVRGTTVTLDSLDADASIRDLVHLGVSFRDLEVTGAGLEEAFLALTSSPRRSTGGVHAGAAKESLL